MWERGEVEFGGDGVDEDGEKRVRQKKSRVMMGMSVSVRMRVKVGGGFYMCWVHVLGKVMVRMVRVRPRARVASRQDMRRV